jgi:iron complex transport system ATP-binding protein
VLLQAADLRFGYPADHRPRAPARPRRPADAGPYEPQPAHAVDGVSLAIDRGALVGILGPNGSGKTTLLRLLSGALGPQSGQVLLDGAPLSSLSRRALARRLAVVPQETELAFDYSVIEIVLMGRYPHLGAFEVEGPDDLAAALQALDATGTANLAERAFRTLSGGEKQRVIIASALAQLTPATASARQAPAFASGFGAASPVPPSGFGAASPVPPAGVGAASPALLFLDEPTASLDLRYQIEVASLVRRLCHERGITILLSTHDLHLAASVCTHLVLLSRGQVLAQGSPGEVLTADLVGRLYGIDPALAAPLVAR